MKSHSAGTLFFSARTACAALCAAVCSASIGCKPAAPPAPEVQVSSDLPGDVADQILRTALVNGGPVGERIAGLSLGASSLPPPAPRPPNPDGGVSLDPPPIAPSTAPAAANGGDLRWDIEPYGAIAAAAKGELLPMPASGEDVPELWRDPGGTWVAIGGRAQVLLVEMDSLDGHPTPVRFTALTEPWLKGKVAVAAPLGGAALAHFAALYEAWGEERMRAWLEGLRQNGVSILANDEEVRLAVVQRRATVGLLGSDEAAKAAASAAHVEVVYPNQKSIGTFVWPTALSRPRNPAHPDAAARLAEKLADRSIEQLLVARAPGFLPLRSGIPTPPGVRSASNLVVISVDPARIVDEINHRRAELEAWVAAVKESAKP